MLGSRPADGVGRKSGSVLMARTEACRTILGDSVDDRAYGPPGVCLSVWALGASPASLEHQ